jgi:hypothetical protein
VDPCSQAPLRKRYVDRMVWTVFLMNADNKNVLELMTLSLSRSLIEVDR